MSTIFDPVPRCYHCGQLSWAGHHCVIGHVSTSSTFKLDSPPSPCTHCYCGSTAATTGERAHRICCNCGNRQAI